MPAGPDSLTLQFKTLSYVPDAIMFASVIIALMYGNQGFLYLPAVFLLLGAVAGAIALHLGWATPFRLLFGLVTVLSAFWSQMGPASPFYVGWAVLILGMGAIMLGGISLETRYLENSPASSGDTSVGAASIGKMTLMIGAYLLAVTIIGLVAMLVSFLFVLGDFPLWAVGTTTAVLVLMFAYLVSRSAEATDQSG
jgi:hypothetical protein